MLILAAMMVSVDYTPVSADGYGDPNSATTTRTFKVSASPKMSCNVALIESAVRNLPVGRTALPANLYAASDRLNAMSRGHIVNMDENGLQVYGHLKEVAHAATLDRLLSAGAVSEHVDGTGMSVRPSVPISWVAETADLDEVGYISLPNYCRTNIGSLQTQGDSLLNLDDLRASFGVSGTG